jgi:uncharacterized protein (TIGR03000 family)
MKKRLFALAAVGILVLASPGTSSAILFGAGGGFGLPYYHYGWGGYPFGYPGAYAAGYGTPVLGYGGAAYAPGYGLTYPYASYALPASTSAAGYLTRFTHAPGSGAAADTTAAVQVEVPANATLWFDGVQTKQTGVLRTFHTPPLERGHSYHYDVKARWEQNGKPVERLRRVNVHAGARVTVDFKQPDK